VEVPKTPLGERTLLLLKGLGMGEKAFGFSLSDWIVVDRSIIAWRAGKHMAGRLTLNNDSKKVFN